MRKRKVILTLIIGLIAFLFLASIHKRLYMDKFTGRTFTTCSIMGFVVTSDLQETEISKIYLAHNKPADEDFHYVYDHSLNLFTSVGACRCWTNHNYYELKKLVDYFSQYEQQHNQPYPEEKKIKLVTQAIDLVVSKARKLVVNYDGNEITIKMPEERR